jgi:regulator of ribonuclease activity B
VIQDMRVQEALEKEGDRLTTPRDIEHWAYFRTENDRTQFVEAVRSYFDNVECYLSPESKHGEFTAKLRHVGLPDYQSMNSTTLLLRRAARAANGDYDGWETRICRD